LLNGPDQATGHEPAVQNGRPICAAQATPIDMKNRAESEKVLIMIGQRAVGVDERSG
jgi:hypothetical protein